MLQIKRAYDPVGCEDGTRVLVDRIWPRGVKKEELHIDLWLKEAAPSTALRQWFGHNPERWEQFQRDYLDELKKNSPVLQPLFEAAQRGNVTLIYAARDTEHNNAVVLKRYLQTRHA